MSGYDTEQLARLEPPYVARYGLRSAPFSSVHEDRFVYLDAERLQQLNMLYHLTQYSELLLIITGVKGIGKTSMLQRFIATANEELVISQVNANPMMDANSLLRAITEGYHLPRIPDDPVELQDMLYHHLADLHHKELTPVLLVDDAHALPQDALETLFNLAETEASDGNLLRIILFSDPQIETMLESPAIQGMRERVTHTMEIPALTAEQTVEYIRHRLLVAGLHGDIPLNAKELKKIYHNSSGIPARINECAHLILNGSNLEQAVKDFHVPHDRRFPVKYIIAVTGIVLLVSLVLLFQQEINGLFEDETASKDTVISEDQISRSLSIPVEPVEPAISADSENSPLSIEQTTAPSVKPYEEITEAPSIGEINKTADSTNEVTDETILLEKDNNIESEKINKIDLPESKDVEPAVASNAADAKAEIKDTVAPAPILVIDAVEPDPVAGSREPQTIKIQGKGFTADTVARVYWSGNKKKLSQKQFKFVDGSNLEINITVGTRADNWKVELTDPISKQVTSKNFAVISAASKEALDIGLADINWVQKQNPQDFTLQLLGSYDKASIIRFVKQYKPTQPVAWYEMQRQGRPWYVLVQGAYKDKPAALEAIKHLSGKIKGIKPWARPFSQIQSGLIPASSAAVKSATIKSAPVKPVPVKPAAIIKTTPPLTHNLAENSSWLWNQDPSHFTLQLMNGQNEKGIRDFIIQHNLKGKAVYYRSQREGQTYYIVLYGNYADRDAARKSIDSLPPALQRIKPWARSFSSIHAELNTR
ncbi:MAG: SPOR domain-containing protein [Gammaproteobacteria bacterium]|nr:SPOR domain-containing protein [Gammaproteobacteria bacterium]